MNLFDYNPAVVLSFILTLMRVSIIMFMLPIFSTQNIPTLVKAAVSLVFTLGVWPAVALSGAFMPAHPFDIAIMLLGEVVVGLVLGMVIDFLFMGIGPGGLLYLDGLPADLSVAGRASLHDSRLCRNL